MICYLEKVYHVSNQPKSRTPHHPDWNDIQITTARYEEYHGKLLLGLPVASFTVTPQSTSIFPFQGNSGEEYYRVAVPINISKYRIFNMNDDISVPDQLHLLCIRRNNMIINNHWPLDLLLGDKELKVADINNYFFTGDKGDPHKRLEKVVAINVYFMENICVIDGTWSSVEKRHYYFGVMQNINAQFTNEQLLDAWVRRQTKRIIKEFVQCFMDAAIIALYYSNLGLY